jgi:thiamine kinase-like enzyme
MVLSEGEIYFIDWGYSHFGFNFSDLSYLWDSNIYSNCPDGWWMIQGEEAEKSIMAYLESIELSKLPARDIMLAVMLRNQLYSYANAVANGLEEAVIECENRLKSLTRTGMKDY